MKKITLLIAFLLSVITVGYGQTVLVDPAAGGGFALGSTFAANGWTASNSANNPWVVGTAAATGALTGNAAYVSNDAGVTLNYTLNAAAVNYFYRDITVPAGEGKIVLTFNWTGAGEDNWDSFQVFAAPTTVVPAASTTSAGNFSGSPVPAGVAGATSIGFGSPQTGVQTATYLLPASLAGTTFRLIFSWRNDTSGGVVPASAIDNISLTSTVPFNAIASGNWNNPATWNKGVVPSCTDDVNILGGFNVTVNSASNVSKSVNIASGSTLTVASGDLTVGCTLNNNLFANNGTLTVTGGTLNVNGNMLHAAASTFNQSGGDINVDGNNAGAAATSVASGTSIVQLNSQFINWTGGTLTIVDPHANPTATDSFNYNNSTANANAGPGHTLRFGNGTSTDAGGNSTNGFRINTFPGSNRFAMGGDLIVNGGSGTNRFVTTGWGVGFVNVTVTAGSVYRDGGNTTYISGNLVNNGTFASTGGVYFGTFLNGNAGTTANAQTVSGTGVFSNNTTVASATANFTSVTVNNSNVAGVSFAGTNNIASQPANSVSASGTLTFTSGKIITTGGASFILGTSSPSAGTLSYTAGGFVSGTTFGRWFTTTGTGTSITAAADATGSGGRYPFVNAANLDRSASIERNTPSAASAGILAVTYTAASGYATISATDGATAIDRKGNDTWAVSVLNGTPTAAASLELQLLGSGTFAAPLNAASTRIIQGSAFAGTHQAGTVTPGGQRLLSPTEIVAGAFSIAASSADLPFVSVASGDWTTPATWSTGVVPVCTDVVNIGAGHTVTVTTAGAVSKNLNIVSGGTLSVSAGDLTVGCTAKNNIFSNNGILTVSGGTVNVNGNMLHASGSTFNHSGGNINVDGNDAGVAATSVASGTAIVQINTNLLNWTGGTLTVVDPHANTTASNSFTFNNSVANVDITAGHTLRFGDGVSTDAGGNATNGFRMSTFAGSNKITFNNIIVNGGTGTNRFVTIASSFGTNGDLTINANSEFRDNGVTIYVARNLVNNGTYVGTGTLYFGSFLNNIAAASANAQTLSGTGTFANALTTPAANLVSVTVNNSNATGVTLSKPLSLSGTLTLTAGKVVTSTANLLTVGTAAAAGTVSGGSATAYVSGPLARTIATANTSYISFPVGKTAYAPIALNPATTAVSVMKAEAFDTNTGTSDPSIINLAANRRWEAPLVSGTMTALNVRLGDANITATKIPVMAPTATGAYAAAFGSTATYTAGTPNTTTSGTAVTAANYTGFVSFADSNVCAGTPAPGNTIASANNICAGASVTLSVQNSTAGTGVTYQWQSSPDNVTYTDIATATAATYTVVPTAVTYYKLKVTCASGPATGTSTPVQLTFANNMGTTTGATRCGAGSVSLSATAATGTIKWYDVATGGAALATGSPFVTNVTATKTFYASTELPGTAVSGGARVGTTATANTTPFEYGLAFNVTSAFTLNSVDVYLAGATAGDLVVALKDNAGVQLQTITVSVPAGSSSAPVAFTVPLGWNIPVGTGFRLLAVSGPALVRESSLGGFPYAVGSVASVTSGYISGTSTSYYHFYNWNYTPVCASPRTAVTATVNTPPAITLSANPAAICAGQTTTAVTIATGAADYDTFVWAPSAGVSGNATTGWTFNPAVTTTYSLQASQSSGALCNAAPVSVVVTVNNIPSTIVLADATYCEGSAAIALTPQGGTNAAVIFTENFNAATNGWTAVNNSTGGTPASAAWILRADNFSSTHSNDSTQFYRSDSDAQGSNSTTDTALSSPVFSTIGYASANVVFYQYFYEPSQGLSTGKVEASLDGTNWTTLQSYDATQGTATAFAQATVALTPAFINQASVYIRFKFDGPWRYYWNIDNVSVSGQKNQNLTWSPATGLYTNAAATTAYVAGTPAATVYVKPTATTTYTVTATNASGCINTDTSAITFSSVPAPAVAASTQEFCNSGTVAGLLATGTAVKWYAAATGGTALTATTALVSGTTYYATQTVNGCESFTRTALTAIINVTAAPTVANSAQVFCNAGTVAELVATGSNIKWYAAATGGTAIAATTALANGSYYASQTINGCEGLTRTLVTVTVNVTPAPSVADDTQEFCNAGTVAELLPNDASIKWYAAATGGTALASTDALASGSYYASQTINGCEGLTRTLVTVTVNVIAAPAIANAAQTFCNAATVADLQPAGADIKWYADATGGTALVSTDALVSGTTYYASQTVNTCEGLVRGAVTATINVTAAPTGDNEQEFCTSASVANLAATGDNIVWYDAETAGNVLAADAALTDGVVYYASQAIDGCEGLTRFGVTAVIHNVVADAPSNVSECYSYELPALTSGAYFTAANGQGTELAAGTAITETTTVYVYAQEGTDVICSDENSFVITIANVPGVTGDATQTVSVNDAADATIADLVVTTVANGAVTWYATQADAEAGTNPLAADTQLVQGATYYAVQTVDTCSSIDVFAVTVDVVLGREGFNVKAFTVYPNPVKDVLNISYSSNITSVAVFNLLGQQVMTLTPNSTDVKVDMSSLAEAPYVVNVTAGNAVKTIKVIKTH